MILTPSLTIRDGGITIISLMGETKGRVTHMKEVVITLMVKEGITTFMIDHKDSIRTKEEPVLHKLMEEPLTLLVLH